ncbi:MAG: squalene--hopene cyclase [Deltaproteobacteria bacterium RBG_13_58_19]|nr:MAG: squalene--hopene cyclase [Deltaproteobacteria bacterium RBG_13_58_19]
MPALSRDFLDGLKYAVEQATQAMLQLQYPEGYWWAELESNVTITSEYLMLHRFLGLSEHEFPRLAAYILDKQLPNGGWSIYYGDGGEISTSVEAYLALKMAGLSPQDERMGRARQFILSRGGALKTRVFTRIFLALFGQISWAGIPLLPVEFMFLPPWSGFSIYEFSSWSRATIVPLMIIMAKRPVCPLPAAQGVAELFRDPSEPFEQHRVAWKPRGPHLENLFVLVDRLLKCYYRQPVHLLRNAALRRAEAWILEHQEESGDWGGIQPAMLNSILGLSCLGYDSNHPVMRRGLGALESFSLADGDRLWLQSCISPVWDTALALRALAAAGVSPQHPAMRQATGWLLSMQILKPGDWCIKNPDLPPGGWAFEFVNNWYPDIDDSAMVLMALKEALGDPESHQSITPISAGNLAYDLKEELPDPQRLQAALKRGLDWCLGMQSRNGGFAAFDVDNTKEWLNAIPFGDLKALVDPPTEDVTGRVLEMLGVYGYGMEHPGAQDALAFIKRTQHPDGPWWGRWGVNYIYGTWSVLLGLRAMGEDLKQPYIRRAATWLKAHQNPDGGWGETGDSYKLPELKGQGPSTASQTAWAVMGLMAAGETFSPQVQAGIEYLLNTQNYQGRWDEEHFTGTGFPSHFMIRYHLYRDCFPLMALGQYLQAIT